MISLRTSILAWNAHKRKFIEEFLWGWGCGSESNTQQNDDIIIYILFPYLYVYSIYTKESFQCPNSSLHSIKYFAQFPTPECHDSTFCSLLPFTINCRFVSKLFLVKIEHILCHGSCMTILMIHRYLDNWTNRHCGGWLVIFVNKWNSLWGPWRKFLQYHFTKITQVDKHLVKIKSIRFTKLQDSKKFAGDMHWSFFDKTKLYRIACFPDGYCMKQLRMFGPFQQSIK